MFERLKALVVQGRLTPTMINNAAAKGWITTEQASALNQ